MPGALTTRSSDLISAELDTALGAVTINIYSTRARLTMSEKEAHDLAIALDYLMLKPRREA